jgi:hypothetical protein
MSQPPRRARQAPSPVLLHSDNQFERQAQTDRVIMREVRQHATVEIERSNGTREEQFFDRATPTLSGSPSAISKAAKKSATSPFRKGRS